MKVWNKIQTIQTKNVLVNRDTFHSLLQYTESNEYNKENKLFVSG